MPPAASDEAGGWRGDRGAPSTHARAPNWARLAEPALRFLRLAARFLCGKVCFSEMRCFMCELDSRGVERLCGTFVGNKKRTPSSVVRLIDDTRSLCSH